MAEIEECIFCKVARGKLPAYILYKDDYVVAFHDINPQAPVHVLIVPIKHISDLEAAAEEDGDIVARMFQVAAQGRRRTALREERLPPRAQQRGRRPGRSCRTCTCT